MDIESKIKESQNEKDITNSVICDACSATFKIELKEYIVLNNGDAVEGSYFICPNCNEHYICSISNSYIKSKMSNMRALELELDIIDKVEEYKKYKKQLNKIIKERKKLKKTHQKLKRVIKDAITCKQ